MRVTSELFVAALVRRAFAEGFYATVMRKGADSAGAVFVAERGRLGDTRIFAPAAQTSYGGEDEGERRFRLVLETADPAAAEALFSRETRFDPDCWIVELEGPAERLGVAIDVTTP